MNNLNFFSIIFIIALIINGGLRLYLSMRQTRHIESHLKHVPQEFSHSISLEDHQHAGTYNIAKQKLAFFSIILDIVVILLLTFGGGLNYLDSVAKSFFIDQLWYGVFLILSVLFVTGLIEFPLNIYSVFGIESKFGFNRMTIKLFTIDTIKQIILGLILGVPLMVVILTLMEKMGSHWWFYVWLTWVGFNLTILTIYPNFIAPMFNQFKPLDNPELKERIETLMTKCGFHAKELFIMDGSTRSSHGNAYFTGLGKNKRIVFFDTLIEQLSPAEIEAVLAHELGHFKHQHIFKRLISMFMISLICLYLLNILMQQNWFFSGLNIQSHSIAMTLVIFMMILPVFLFIAQPISSFYSRKHEFEADNYASKQANAQDLIQALVKLYKDNASTLTPDPLYSAIYDSHPPAHERIANLRKSIIN